MHDNRWEGEKEQEKEKEDRTKREEKAKKKEIVKEAAPPRTEKVKSFLLNCVYQLMKLEWH